MFSSQDLVTWVFCMVATNVISTAEKNIGPPAAPGRAGARGVDRARNKSVYWPEALSWQLMNIKDTGDRISLQSFANLLYTLHPPTSALSTTVRRAVVSSEKVAVLGALRLFQFRTVMNDYPTLLAPIFLVQAAMRAKLLGEAWWADKRQIFRDARELVKEENMLQLRFKVMAKQQEQAKKKKEEEERVRKEKKLARIKARAAAVVAAKTGTDTDTDTDTSDSEGATSTGMLGSMMSRFRGATGMSARSTSGADATGGGGGTRDNEVVTGTGTGTGMGTGGGGGGGSHSSGALQRTVSGGGATRTVSGAHTHTKG
jgi:hypothetical protein